MPKRYEEMRDKFIKEGMPAKQAKEKAARIYNATRKRGEPALHSGKESGRKGKGR